MTKGATEWNPSRARGVTEAGSGTSYGEVT